MNNNKTVQIIIRTTEEEKEKISISAKSEKLSMNDYIKKCIKKYQKADDSQDSKKDKKNNEIDINFAITVIDTLKEQLTAKDIQITQLQQIIYNRDTKLLEAPKHWWQFWK